MTKLVSGTDPYSLDRSFDILLITVDIDVDQSLSRESGLLKLNRSSNVSSHCLDRIPFMGLEQLSRFYLAQFELLNLVVYIYVSIALHNDILQHLQPSSHPPNLS